MSDSRSLETLTAEDFRRNRGSSFKLTAGAPSADASISVNVELVEVAEQPDNASSVFRTPFSLLFHGPLEPFMPQGMYRLEHEGLGAFDLFVVPIGPDEPSVAGQRPTATRYEIVFG